MAPLLRRMRCTHTHCVCHTGTREGMFRVPPPASMPSPQAYMSTKTLGCFSSRVSWESHTHDSLVFWGHCFELERGFAGPDWPWVCLCVTWYKHSPWREGRELPLPTGHSHRLCDGQGRWE